MGYSETNHRKLTMFHTYAIRITEENLDLIETLNGDVRPAIENGDTYLLTSPKSDTPNDIKTEDEIYGDDGHLRDTAIVIIP